MKQGSAPTRMAGAKREPAARAINPGPASMQGIQEIRTKTTPMVAGRGFNAPAPVATTQHKSGSQGKHR